MPTTEAPRKRRKVSPSTGSSKLKTPSSQSQSAQDHLLDQDAIRRHMLELMQQSARKDNDGENGEDSRSESDEGSRSGSGSESDEAEDEEESGSEDGGSVAGLASKHKNTAAKLEASTEESDSEKETSKPQDTAIKPEPPSNPSTHPLKSRITILPKSQSHSHPTTPDIKPKIQLKHSFSELGIGPRLISALASISIKKPTEIQSACIEPILSGRDCIGGAKTGSGKTMAFALPILQRISRDPFGIFAVVLTPTRELAFQLAEQFIVLGKPLGFTTTTIVGGLDMMTQARELCDKPHVVVATPGRLCDLLRSSSNGQWDLSRVKVLVLDEADRMLTPTFAPDLKFLFSSLPEDRQTLLFTATISPQIEALAERPPTRKGKQKPFIYRIESDTLTVKNLRQEYLFIPGHIRDPYLYYLLRNPPRAIAHLRFKNKKRGYEDEEGGEDEEEEEEIPSTIIFTQRCQTAHLLHLILTELSIPSVPLHSHLSQPERLASLARFRAGSVPVLVTTDVGSRGLDIPEVAMVINFDCPRTGEDYVHRVGRTARAGRGGLAVTIVTERDVDLVKGIEELTNVKLTEMDLPEEKVLENLNPVATARRVANLAMQDSAFGERQAVNKAKEIKRRRRDAKMARKA